MDYLQFDSWQGQGIFLFSKTSRQNVGLIQPPLLLVLGFFPASRIGGAIPLLPSLCLPGVNIDNFNLFTLAYFEHNAHPVETY
jgi:hypothetical protein